MSLRLLIAITAVSLSLFAGVAHSQEGPKITNESKAYGDWTVKCATKEGQAKRCLMQQQALLGEGDTKRPVLAINITKSTAKANSNKMTFILPLGTYLPAGMQLYLNGKMDKNIPIMFCDQRGCYVNVLLEKELIDQMISAKNIDIATFSIQNTEKPVQIPVSNKGFKKALAAL